MLCFPLDNTEYMADALGAWCGTRTRGVFAADTHYTVSANGDMTVTLSPGLAWLKADTYWGVNVFEINPTILAIATADGSLSRYAAVCLQLDKNQNVGGVVVKYGPYGTNPALSSLPLPVQNSLDYDEIYVAALRVRAGATSILTTDITDLRINETYCGIMRDGVTGIPTQSLYDAWWAWFSALQIDTEAKAAAFTAWMVSFRADNEAAFAEWITGFKGASQADFDTWFTSFKSANSSVYYDWYNAFVSDSETNFNDWFQNLQDILDENQAANLLNEINHHKTEQAADAGGVHGIRYLDGRLQVNLGIGWATLAEVVRGLRSTYIDALSLTSFDIDALRYTPSHINSLIEVED